ncbi:MAG: hypothetical protein BGN86_14850 [Caulobacterales bacterium 68-7]|nr:MAG: hypothetical protein BGN86_14850 [Caulobacterales bacterium 68-7]
MSASEEDIFIADDNGPPTRRYYISRDPPATSNREVRGWAMICEVIGPNGKWEPDWDTWEQWFFELLRYLPEPPPTLVWRRQANGEVVELPALQTHYDGRIAGPNDTPESAGVVPPR